MIEKDKIANLRRNYSLKELTEKIVDPNPFTQFSHWFNEILKSDIKEPNAMVLATASAEGTPSARTVLLKKYDESGFVFFTNYESHKAKDLTSNPYAEILFVWLDLERQVRIRGRVEKVSAEESEEYFHSRPTNSQIGAWASQQSSVIPDREFLEEKFRETAAKYKDGRIPLPPFWGGFRLIPDEFEFWQGRESRLHDRISYRLNKDNWKIVRLSP